MKRQDSFDIAKFVFALMVISIHVNPVFGGGIGSPVFPTTRIAVPMFFIFSGYFLFRKLRSKNDAEQFSDVKIYVTRLVKLYFVWFVLLFPITFLRKGYFEDGMGIGIIKLVKSFFLGSTFRASWYLMALILGILIVYGLSRITNDKVILCIGFIIYLCCSLLSNYSAIGETLKVISDIRQVYPNMFNGFAVSIIWIALGKQFADDNSMIKISKFDVLIFILSFALLFVENKVIVDFNLSVSGTQDNDCYLLLLPFCCSLFRLVQAWNVNLKNREAVTFFRISSTVIYCLHASLISVLAIVFRRMKIPGSPTTLSVILYVLTLFICCGVSWICLIAKKNNRFKVLQLLY